MKKLSIFFAALMACTLSFATDFEKVTVAPDDWSGDYLLVYEKPNTDTAFVWKGVDAEAAHDTLRFVNGKIATDANVVTISIAPMEKGYSLLVKGGSNDGKFVGYIGNKNGMNFGAAAILNNIAMDGTNVKITSGSIPSAMRFNNAKSNGNRFRYYKTGQQPVQLYKKVAGAEIPATAIELNQTTLELEQYKYVKLVATLTPAEATTEVVWTSSDEKVATVVNGRVNVLAASGTTTITATAGTVSATCELTAKAASILTCAEAKEKALAVSADNELAAGGQYVIRGYVTNIAYAYADGKGMSVWMADTKDGGKVFEAYSVNPIMESDKKIAVGNFVEVVGDLTKYGTTAETAKGGTITRKYVISATSADETLGAVSGAGIFDENAEVILKATPVKGYKFIGWSNGETVSPLTFKATEDVTITANFQAAANTFAYALKSELNAAGTELAISYTLNNDAKAVRVIIMNGEEIEKTVECAGITKGIHEETIDVTALTKKVKLTWKVEVEDFATAEVAEFGTTYSFYHPSAVDIDLNPESENFGRILCNEAMQVVTTKIGYHSSQFGAGIYAFTPDFEPIKNGDKDGFNGGNTFTNTTAQGKTAYAPRRIRIAKDGRIFATSLNTNGTYLWEINSANLDEWTPVITGTPNDLAELVDAEGNFIAAPNAGFDVRGEGENLQLLMLSSNTKGFDYVAAGYKCAEYNLGTATTWAVAPSKVIFDGKYGVSNTGVQVQYDAEGGVWFSQYRATPKEAEPALKHFNAAGEEDYTDITTVARGGGFRFNHDFTKVVIADNGKKAAIYAVSKDADGKPVLTKEMEVSMTTPGNNLNDFAWDYANNLYVVSNSNEKFVGYALPHAADTKVATPAASKYAFTIDGTGTYVDNTEANATVTEKIIRNGQVLIIRDGKTYNMMGQIVE